MYQLKIKTKEGTIMGTLYFETLHTVSEFIKGLSEVVFSHEINFIRPINQAEKETLNALLK